MEREEGHIKIPGRGYALEVIQVSGKWSQTQSARGKTGIIDIFVRRQSESEEYTIHISKSKKSKNMRKANKKYKHS